MKKSIIVLICLVLLIAGCGKKKEKVEDIQPLENYEIIVSASSKDSVTVHFKEIKSGDSIYCLTDDYYLEKLNKSGEWEKVKVVNDVEIEPVGHCAEEFEVKHDIKARYGSLKDGTYRIVKVAYSESGGQFVTGRDEVTIKLVFLI